MHRLWVRWALLIVFVGLIGTVFVNLGDWQLDRLRQRRERNAATNGNGWRPEAASTPIISLWCAIATMAAVTATRSSLRCGCQPGPCSWIVALSGCPETPRFRRRGRLLRPARSW